MWSDVPVIRAVLFDLDDTLTDHHTAAGRAVVHWAHEHRLAGRPAELAQRWTAISNRHYSAYQRRELTVAQQQRLRAREFLHHLDLGDDAAAQAAFDRYAELYRAASTAHADARPALERAHAAGLAVGVLTNGEDSVQRAKLARAGLTPLVDVFVASSSLPWSKPDRRAFHTACGRLGVEVAGVLMVGDNLVADVHGARDAGLPAVLVDRFDAHAEADLRGAVRVASLNPLFT